MPSGVEFDEDNMSYGRSRAGMPGSMGSGYGAPAEQKGMAGWLVRHGLAKSNGGAQVVMIGIVIANAIIMFILIKFFL